MVNLSNVLNFHVTTIIVIMVSMALLLEYIITSKYIFRSNFLRCCQSSTICNSHILNLEILHFNSYLFLESCETYVTRDLSFDIILKFSALVMSNIKRFSSDDNIQNSVLTHGSSGQVTTRLSTRGLGQWEETSEPRRGTRRLPPRSSTSSRHWSSRKLACACSCERVLR